MNYFDNTDRKRLCECTDEEIACVVRTIADGKTWEVWNGSKWAGGLDSRIFPNIIYRVPKPPTRKTVYPWHEVLPEYAQWAARDENGDPHFYEREPEEGHGVWGNGGQYMRADVLVGYIRGDEPWRESKQKRPEGV